MEEMKVGPTCSIFSKESLVGRDESRSYIVASLQKSRLLEEMKVGPTCSIFTKESLFGRDESRSYM